MPLRLKPIVFLSLMISAPKIVAMEANSLSIELGQTRSDYFGDRLSNIEPTSQGISYGRKIAEDWLVEVNYQKMIGEGQWLNPDVLPEDVFNRAETESSTTGFSVYWQATDDLGVNFSYVVMDSKERSITYVPRIIEWVVSDDTVYSLSVDDTIEFDNVLGDNSWSFNWGVGAQYADFDVQIINKINIDPATFVRTQAQQTSLSGYVDMDISYSIESTSFSWSPYLALSWNWEVDATGDQVILVSQGDVVRELDESNARFSNAYRRPDSGVWNVGLLIFWDSGWGTSISYAQTLATEFDLESLSIDVSVFF